MEGRAEASEEVEAADEIDPDEPRYCICDDVSYGQMISCDNNVSFIPPTTFTTAASGEVDGRWWTVDNGLTNPTVRQRVVSPSLYEHDRRRHTFPPREMVLS
jgi:hypothetical protein